MQVKMKMPDLATTEAAVKVLRWLVEPGQAVKRGQPLLEIETDKAAMEVESVATGVLAEVHAQPDEEVEVGRVIATIEVQASPRAVAPAAATPASGPASGPVAAPPVAASGTQPARPGGMFSRNRGRSPAGGSAS